MSSTLPNLLPIEQRPRLVLIGQTPPPWHGQAVATQILFDHDWPDFEVHRVRMEFSSEMEHVGQFQWRKVRHLITLTRLVMRLLKERPGSVMLYPPASAKWVPFFRDACFLALTRPLAARTVFIYHASGLPVFIRRYKALQRIGEYVYGGADLSLEVAQEKLSPHEAFSARQWTWCPCGIAVPELPDRSGNADRPLEVLFVGSLQEGKGVLDLLRTAALLKERGLGGRFRFRIVGKWFSSAFEQEARALHRELGLEEAVEFSGQLTGDDKWQAYARADVFFFPTHYASEATPIVIMEALGSGLPVLSTRWAGIPAMLEGCDTAELRPVRSPEAYAEVLGTWEAQRDSLAAMAERSKAFYRGRYLPARFVERVEKGLLGLTDREAPAAAVAATPAPSRPDAPPLRIATYLADQNPGFDRSYGISRMSHTVLSALATRPDARIHVIASATSQRGPDGVHSTRVFPWSTRSKLLRLLTDHLHPLFDGADADSDIHYYPKGFLPLVAEPNGPKVVTVHDTILQYYWDHYPEWRNSFEYSYWARMLKQTLVRADRVLTVSQSSKRQIEDFIRRHGLPEKDIVVTYEPCLYESIPQPETTAKGDFAVHLASREPHKRTAQLVEWWAARAEADRLPVLHLIGRLPPEAEALAESSPHIVNRPFLSDAELREELGSARALVVPSEVEGFGLPAIEAYYLGTPVCHVAETSVEEILAVATDKGRFRLDEPASLKTALDEVLAMTPAEIRQCGLVLRDAYSTERVAQAMMDAFHDVAEQRTRES